MRSHAKTVLILGGGVMQIPALRIAKKRGWRVIMADVNPDAPGVALADVFENIDLKDRKAMAEMAMRHAEKGGLNGVFTAGTDFSTTVSWVAQVCNLPGIPYEVALNATDKVRMRRAFKRAGVPCPQYIGLSSKSDPEKILDLMEFPVVVKPVDSMGAREVRKVDSVHSLKIAFQRAIEASRTDSVIVESFMEGPELSLDAIIDKGKITVCGVADRHIYFPPHFVELGHTIPSSLEKEVLNEVEAVFARGIKALGIETGTAKGDIKVTLGGAMVGEIAARLSGGYMSGWTFPYSSGVTVTEAALNIAMGLPPGDLRPRHRAHSAERALISIPGILGKIVGHEEAALVPGVKDIFVQARNGDQVVFPTNNVQKCGNVISRSEDRETAISAAEKAIGKFFLRLEPDNSETDSFLFSEDNFSGHRNGSRGDGDNTDSGNGDMTNTAFELTRSENIEVFNKMSLVGGEGGELEILMLPGTDREIARDWHGLDMKDSLKKISALTGVPRVRRAHKGRTTLGKLFWKAFLKGGVQGGVYIVDTMRAKTKKYLASYAKSNLTVSQRSI